MAMAMALTTAAATTDATVRILWLAGRRGDLNFRVISVRRRRRLSVNHAFYGQCFGFGINRPARATQLSLAARGMAMAKSGVKPLIFLIAVSVMAWVAGMTIHGF